MLIARPHTSVACVYLTGNQVTHFLVFDLAALVRRAFVAFLLVHVGVPFGCSGPFHLCRAVRSGLSVWFCLGDVGSVDLLSFWRESSRMHVLAAIARGSASL